MRAIVSNALAAFLVALGGLIPMNAQAADDALIAAAKKEARVVWYSTQQVNPFIRPIATAFQKKYGIAVDYVRADSSAVALRILNEGKAHSMHADVFDGTDAAAALKKAGMAVKWLPDNIQRLPASDYDKEGYWAAINLYVITAGYNTTLIKPGTEPRSFQDLLDPRFQGKMVWNTLTTVSGGPGFVGLILKTMGQDKGTDYLRALAKQNIAGVQSSARQVLDQVVAGEYAIGLQIFNHAAVLSERQGAPVNWIPMNPSLVTVNVMGLTAGGPHPNAAKLFEDFVVSSEGQELVAQAALLPADPAVTPFDPSLRPDGARFTALTFTPEELEQQLPGWTAAFNSLFR